MAKGTQSPTWFKPLSEWTDEEKLSWIRKMIDLEETRGEFPPGGFGGVGAKVRRGGHEHED
jgi:hypothetical protein